MHKYSVAMAIMLGLPLKTKTGQDLCILPPTVQPQGYRSPPTHNEFKLRLKARSTQTGLECYPKKPDKKRTILPSKDGTIVGPNQEPSIAALITAVMNGEMILQYYNLIQIRDSAAALDNFLRLKNEQQGIIEVAWLVGGNNAIANVKRIISNLVVRISICTRRKGRQTCSSWCISTLIIDFMMGIHLISASMPSVPLYNPLSKSNFIRWSHPEKLNTDWFSAWRLCFNPQSTCTPPWVPRLWRTCCHGR